MHTFLIIGGSLEDRKNKITSLLNRDDIRAIDIKTLELSENTASLGIKAVKEWQKQLLLMPRMSPFTAGLIMSADLLTTEAQNALLKTLEEPPKHTRIYMEAPSDVVFLPTILSRSEIMQLPTHALIIETAAQILEQLKQLTDPKTSTGQVVHMIDSDIKNKEEAATWLSNAITVLHNARQNFSKTTYISLMNHLLLGLKQLHANVSYKLVLDQVFLSEKH